MAYGEAAELRPGERVLLPDGRTEFFFLEVVRDSRCPTGTSCVRAGEAVVRLRAGSREQELELPAREATAMSLTPGAPDRATLSLNPYPQAGAGAIPENDYRLTLLVTK